MTKTSNWEAEKHIDSVSIKERERLVRATPGFSSLNVAEMGVLISLMTEITFNTGEYIVSEGDLIDAVYILVSGVAEVSKHISQDERGNALLGVLTAGESIGLMRGGELFSETGMRTASVMATNTCLLLRLSIDDFHKFLQEHPESLSNARERLALTLRMQLIKSVAIFSALSNQRIYWLANLIKETHLSPQEYLFKQYDKADACYLITKGEIEIGIQHPDGTTEIKAILHEGQIFGEAALLSEGYRDSDARAKNDCSLLILSREILNELIYKEPSAHLALTSLVTERQQPIRKEGVIYHHRPTADGATLTILKDPANNTYIQLTEEGWIVWQQLNGTLTTQEIYQNLSASTKKISKNMFLSILRSLVDANFAYMDLNQTGSASDEMISQATARTRFQHVIKNIDKKIRHVYRYGGKYLLTLPMIIFFSIVSIAGLFLFISGFNARVNELSQINHIIYTLIAVIPACMFLRLFGVFIEALLMQKIGYEVQRGIIAWYIMGPILYIDESPLLLSSRLQRMAAIITPPFTDLVMTALLLYLAYSVGNNNFTLFAWLCAVFMYLNIFRSLDPMLNLQGYKLLAEFYQLPNLRERAFNWLIPYKRNEPDEKSQVSNIKFIIGFWLYSCLYLASMLIIIMLIKQQFIVYWPKQVPFIGVIPYVFVILFLSELGLEWQHCKKNHLQLD